MTDQCLCPCVDCSTREPHIEHSRPGLRLADASPAVVAELRVERDPQIPEGEARAMWGDR